jgi:VIT1/CCC1 family predicted Fe2+/Mn2+ transporter
VNKHTTKEIWESTIATFVSKFAFALTFVIPVLLFPLTTAIYVSIVWGFTLLGLFSFYIAKEQGVKPWKVVIEHLIIALAVIIITHYVGDWISGTFC